MASSPYLGKRIFLATKHQKERVVQIPFLRRLGATVICSSDFDTDTLGTFSGSVERTLTPREAAIKKATIAAKISPDGLGLGSEGSVGPDPHIPFISTNEEIVAFVDLNLKLTSVARRVDRNPEYRVLEIKESYEVASVVSSFRYLPYGVVLVGVPEIRSVPFSFLSGPKGRLMEIARGISSPDELSAALFNAFAESKFESIKVATDFRAHMNPRRMLNIGRAARALVEKLRNSCPRCLAPGYDFVKPIPGLPCEVCSTLSDYPVREVWGCGVCGYQAERARVDGVSSLPSQYCAYCNP